MRRHLPVTQPAFSRRPAHAASNVERAYHEQRDSPTINHAGIGERADIRPAGEHNHAGELWNAAARAARTILRTPGRKRSASRLLSGLAQRRRHRRAWATHADLMRNSAGAF